MQNKVLWTVSLSNGETLYENKGNFQIIEGALSPWQRLLLYIIEKQSRITSLSLYTDDGKRWNLPSAGKSPNYAEMSFAPKPSDFRMFRKAAIEKGTGGDNQANQWSDLHTCIEAMYADGSALQVWVSERTQNAWSVYFDKQSLEAYDASIKR